MPNPLPLSHYASAFLLSQFLEWKMNRYCILFSRILFFSIITFIPIISAFFPSYNSRKFTFQFIFFHLFNELKILHTAKKVYMFKIEKNRQLWRISIK